MRYSLSTFLCVIVLISIVAAGLMFPNARWLQDSSVPSIEQYSVLP